MVTACGEAATNAIEHAGGGTGMPFEVSGQIGGPRHRADDPRLRGLAATCARATTAADSRSWSALMDSVDVTPTAEGTTVRMSRTLNAAAMGDHKEPD